MPAIANYVQEIRNIIVKLPPFIRTQSEPRKARHSEFSCFCVAKCEPFGEQKKTREVSVANDERHLFQQTFNIFLNICATSAGKIFSAFKVRAFSKFCKVTSAATKTASTAST